MRIWCGWRPSRESDSASDFRQAADILAGIRKGKIGQESDLCIGLESAQSSNNTLSDLHPHFYRVECANPGYRSLLDGLLGS